MHTDKFNDSGSISNQVSIYNVHRKSLDYSSHVNKTSIIVNTIKTSLGTLPTTLQKPVTEKKVSHKGMVWIPGGTFMMGATDKEGRLDEYPAHLVKVKGFWMDIHEVTNAEFRKFVEAT
ncbi:MAG: formylglycine-generating enzyme family protein, partial [Acidobacterium ailaaui]|nr:formylglycine-generating enzyme family protein [Pseudacidobacterium ailaaui]